MSRDTNTVLGHADDNDGIEEYDNPLPAWWVGLFVVTIVWGVGYGIHYHFIAKDSQILRYTAQMAAADERWPQSDVAAPLTFDPETLTAGAQVFEQNCVACHMAGGAGGPIGPSLIDAVWIHGADPETIRTTISEGVTTKGMPAWGQILGPDKVAKVTAYVVDLHEKSGSGVAPATAEEAPATAEEAPVAEAPPVDWEALSEEERQAMLMARGEVVYTTGDGAIPCTSCHQADGKGLPGAFPPLVGQRDHMGDCATHAGLVINGMSGPIEVDGVTYNGTMVPQGEALDDLQIAAVISYERNSWGNDFGWCSPADVAAARATP